MELIRRLMYMEDVSPNTWSKFKASEDALRNLFRLYNYQPIESPLLEPTELFVRKSGGELATQMYTFTEPGGSQVSLRPEFTSSVIRNVLESSETDSEPMRGHYAGPVFRYFHDGQRRQFTQVGAEFLHASGQRADVEILTLSSRTLTHLGLTKYKLVLNDSGIIGALLKQIGLCERTQTFILSSIGDFRGGKRAVEKVRRRAEHIGLLNYSHNKGIVDSSSKKINKASLRKKIEELLQPSDGVVPGQRGPEEIAERFIGKAEGTDSPSLVEKGLHLVSRLAVIKGRPEIALKKARELVISSDLKDSCLDYVDQLTNLMAQNEPSVPLILDFGLARGMGYYTGIVFDITHPNSHFPLGGGGRYDDLAQTLGSPNNVPACGFAHNLEQVMESCEREGTPPFETMREKPVLVWPRSSDAYNAGLMEAKKLRAKGVTAELDVSVVPLPTAIKYAKKRKIGRIIIVGENGDVTEHKI